jgi:outer membrane lipoprotein-sorting protein
MTWRHRRGGCTGLGVALAGLTITLLPSASVAQPDGSKIFQEAYQRDIGYVSFAANVTMLLKEKSGSVATRKLDIASKEVKGDGARTLVTFSAPSDVKGTKVLTASHWSKADEQWIFLPAFSRVKQISTANQSASFMGSEFSYEDLNSINIQVPKFSYKYLKDEPLDGVPCFVVERRPRYDNSAYVRQTVWVDKKDYTIRRVEFFDAEAGESGAPMKVLTAAGYQHFLDRHFRAAEMVMANNRNGKTTILQWAQYRFGAAASGVKDGDFELSALKR